LCLGGEEFSLLQLGRCSSNALADFRRLAAEAAADDSCIADGNYGVVRDLTWPRAELVCWLNYSLPTIFGRALKRTVRRVVSQEKSCGGNQESFRRAFFSTDSTLW
jgi:hypothetical protein